MTKLKLRLLTLILFCPVIISAQTNNLLQSNDEISTSRQTIITKTVKEVSPAVVGINVTEIREYRDAWSQNPFYRQFFGDRVYRFPIKSLGSGAIISPDGYIITNDHVAGNAIETIVTLTDGRKVNAKVIGTDRTSDICLLKIEEKNLPYIKLGDSDNLMIGEWVIALGNPFGLFDINDKPTVTVGVLSSMNMNLGASEDRYYFNMIQTDAAINAGNSGGPLVNAIGELIGMNTIIYTGGAGGNVGVGFAIPVNKIKRIVDELKSNGQVTRNFWTGLTILTVDVDLAKTYGLKTDYGAIIQLINKNSPADKAGLQVGDIIVGVNGNRVNNDVTFISVVNEYRTNDVLEIKVMRDDKELNKKLKLEKVPK